MDKKNKIERCGFCGRYFIGINLLTLEECKKLTNKELNEAPLGYCPDAQAEDYEQNPENYHNRVTRDMAIDAGQPDLEGQLI